MKKADSEKELLNPILDEVRRRGLGVSELIYDGKWHRFNWNANDTKKKGSYRIIETSAGFSATFKNWKSEKESFTVKHCMDGADMKLLEARLLEYQEAEERKAKIRWDTVRIEAEKEWSSCENALDHPYLEEKKVGPFGLKVSPLGALMIPLRDSSGALWNIQFIQKDGSKYFKRGGRVKGLIHLLADSLKSDYSGPLYLVEGYATAATLKDMGFEVACAFSSHFLEEAGKTLRLMFPKADLVISGDADVVGLAKSRKAARVLKAKYIVPSFRSPHPETSDWNDLKSVEGEMTVKHQIENPKNILDGVSTKNQWLLDFVEKHEIKVLYNGLIKLDGESYIEPEIVQKAILESDNDGINIPTRNISSFFGAFIKKEISKHWEDMKEKILKFDEAATLESSSFIAYLTTTKTLNESYLAAFHHFIWQVKRKLDNLPVDYHMMPVFVGESGAGKSIAIKKLLDPISPLWSLTATKTVTDPRSFQFFSKNLVGFIDEMDIIEFKDIEPFKRHLSADLISERILGTNSHAAVENRCTFIAASNKSVKELVHDETSARRLYEIQVLPKDALTAHWELLNQLNFTKIWHAVDHKKPSPIIEHIKDIQDDQAKIKYQDVLELFIEWAEIKGPSSDEDFVSNEQLVRAYRAFCEENNCKPMHTSQSIGIRLGRLGFKRSQRRMGGKRPFGWAISLNFNQFKP